MNEKRCNNCKYFLKKFIEEPCIECIQKSGLEKWEPDEEMQRVGKMNEKRCTNCKHFFTREDEYPCIDCIDKPGFIKWEPAEETSEQKQGLEKGCLRCRHFDTDVKEEPCKTCVVSENFTKWEPKGKQIKLEKRPEIMPVPVAIYEHVDSEIPERVRILFTNGTSAIYDLHTDQPAPVILENIKIIRRMKQGYVNQPARRRRRK